MSAAGSMGLAMEIRPFADGDLQPVVELTIETFRPFYEQTVPEMMGEEIFAHQHGHWEQDYRDEVPTWHDPATGRHVAVAEADGAVVGCVAWLPGARPHSGQIYLLAVAQAFRRKELGRRLCEHAIAAMKADGIEFVGIGTGGDPFHAPARALYEDLGFRKIPIAGYLKKI